MKEQPGYRPLKMKDLPAAERPREKVLMQGVKHLTEAELLAILLRTGTKNVPVRLLAEKLIAKFGLAGLAALSPQELSHTPGIGEAKAVTVLAGMELGKRLSLKSPEQRVIIKSPQDVADLTMPYLRYEKKEHFLVLLLSTKNHVLAQRTISVGSLNASVVHPRELFREALHYAAASVILVHNHPSGDPQPSQEDIVLSKKIVQAGQVLSISVLDHVIIGDGKYVSLKEKGIL